MIHTHLFACRSTQFLAVGFEAGQPSPYLAPLLWAQGQRQQQQSPASSTGADLATDLAVLHSSQQGGDGSSSSSSSMSSMPEVWCSWHIHPHRSLPAKLALVQDPEFLPGTPPMVPEWQPLLNPAEYDDSVMNKALQVGATLEATVGSPQTAAWHSASCRLSLMLGGCDSITGTATDSMQSSKLKLCCFPAGV
jgi:hypothetical protein